MEDGNPTDHSRSEMYEACPIIIHEPGMRFGQELGTFGLAEKGSKREVKDSIYFREL